MRSPIFISIVATFLTNGGARHLARGEKMEVTTRNQMNLVIGPWITMFPLWSVGYDKMSVKEEFHFFIVSFERESELLHFDQGCFNCFLLQRSAREAKHLVDPWVVCGGEEMAVAMAHLAKWPEDQVSHCIISHRWHVAVTSLAVG